MKFRLISLLLISLVYGYLSWSLCWPFKAWSTRLMGMAFLLILVAAIAWLPLVFWQSTRDDLRTIDQVILIVAFFAMAILSFLFVIALVRDLLSLLSPIPLRTPAVSLGTLAATVGLCAVGYWNAHQVHTRTVKVPVSFLPRQLEGFRITQISDLHVGATIGRSFVEGIVQQVNATEPDLIAVTGDTVDGTPAGLAEALRPLQDLKAKYGKYLILGNHEYYWEAPRWITAFRSLGFVPLVNQHAIVRVGDQSLLIAGVADNAARMFHLEGANPAGALDHAPGDAVPRILLAHHPGLAEEAEQAGYQLTLSGHTHGGQFFPWTIVAGWIHRHVAGVYSVGKMSLYVSRGTGYWGPPVRLGSPAEISVLTLHGR